MKSKIAISSLNNVNDAQLIVESSRILTAMAGNAAYPAPVPALADVQALHDAFVATVNALDGGINSTASRDKARAALQDSLRSLSLYVQQTSQGDLVTLLSSGYAAQKGRQPPVGQLSPPQNVRLTRTDLSGQLKARCDVVPNARMYQWRIANTLTPTTWTISDPTTTANFTLANLTAGASYLVQARALGAQGPTDWSDAATMMSV